MARRVVSDSNLDVEFAVQVDDVGGGVTYVGKATPGTVTSVATWQIMRVTESGTPTDTAVEWAGGSAAFDNIYDNRAALSYS